MARFYAGVLSLRYACQSQDVSARTARSRGWRDSIRSGIFWSLAAVLLSFAAPLGLGLGDSDRCNMTSNFVELPAEAQILERLRAIEGPSRARDLVFQKVARQLDGRTLDSAAFSFLLMEMLHRFEWALGEEAALFLPKCILALTGDEELASAAREAYDELGPAADAES